MTNEDQTTSETSSAIASVAVSVAKDLAVTVAGTVIGLGLLNGGLAVVNKIQSRRAARQVVETTVVD